MDYYLRKNDMHTHKNKDNWSILGRKEQKIVAKIV